MMRSFQTRHVAPSKEEALLREYATVFSKAKHTLFVKTLAAGGDKKTLNTLKRDFCREYGFTSRQYNALQREVQGMIDGTRELQKQHVEDLEAKVEALSVPPEKRKKRKFAKRTPETSQQAHERKRRRYATQQKLAAEKADIAAGTVRVAFGSKKLFNAQHHLEENGFADHSEWKAEWEAKRENQFFVLGSGDESGGCQGCVASVAEDGKIRLSVRLPNCAEEKHVKLEGLDLNVGDSAIRAAIAKNEAAAVARRKKLDASASPEEIAAWKKECKGIALSWRFLWDEKGLRIVVSTDLPEVKIVSIRAAGRISMDLNAEHLAVTEINRHGNIISRTTIPLILAGKSSHQTKALIGEAVKQIVALAVATKKPIAVEKLDFQNKKATMREDGGARYARMLSSLAYAAILGTILSRAFDAGIEVFEENPAFTSVIGEHLFQRRYGMSRHQGAAMAIGRRSMRFRERLPSSLRGTLPATCKDRRKHAWSLWAVVLRRKAALAAPVTPRKSTSPPRKSRREKPGSHDAGQVAGTGGSPVGESHPQLFGVRPRR